MASLGAEPVHLRKAVSREESKIEELIRPDLRVEVRARLGISYLRDDRQEKQG